MGVLKKLRRILRRYRGILVIGCFLLVFASFWNDAQRLTDEGDSLADEAIDVMSKSPVELVLETRYVCGTETEVKQFENIQALEAWLEEEGDAWQLVEKKENSFKVIKEVEDLSPLCKNEGYFGLTEDGILTLFQGPPEEKQVIESFFRIDTDLLNVSLPTEEIEMLKKGIRVANVAEYFSILSTYGQYATEY